MAFEDVPGSVATDDNLLVLFIPAGGIDDVDAPTAAELNAATVKRITYSLTPTGYNRTITQATEEDPRLTLGQVLETPGKVTEGVEVQYVHGADDDVADTVFVQGAKGFIAERRAVPNGQDIAAGDTFDVIPITVGKPRKDAPAANGKFTKTTKLFVTGRVGTDAVVVA